MLVNSIEELIGKTPLLKIDPTVHGLKNIDLYAKLEYLNPFGSVKDRIAKGMLAPYWNKINLKSQMILESSSGNTAKAIATLANIHGTSLKTITNRIHVPEQRKILQLLQADITELPGISECPEPSDPDNPYRVAEKLVSLYPSDYHYTNQYASNLNLQSHMEAGVEINQDLGIVDYYIGFLGTTGSTRGAGIKLKEHNPGAKIIGVVSEVGNHIPGGRAINELWDVGLYEKSFYSEIIPVTTAEAIDAMLRLVRRSGMFCGPTTGANFHAAMTHLKKIDHEHDTKTRQTAVFIACDRLEPYISYIERYRPEIFDGEKQSQQKIHNNPALVVPTLTPASLSSELSEFKTIIDIRTSDAYQLGHITGAINIREDVLADLIDKPFLADGKVVVYCRKGSSSKQYVSTLKSQGYDAYSLDGGIQSWVDQGYDLSETFDDCDISNKDLK